MIIKLASAFCIAAHSAIGQKRKYTDRPYYEHPVEVAELLKQYIDDENVIAAALLHDVIEDTQVDIIEIELFFGKHIANLVMEVSEVSQSSDGNRAMRKAIDRDHYAAASPSGQSIKVADMICNTRDIIKYDPNFAKVYMVEKRELFEVLTKADPDLRNLMKEQLDAYFVTGS